MVGDFEDSDFCLKLARSGSTLWLVPEARLWHLERQSQAIGLVPTRRRLLTFYNGWRYKKRIDRGELPIPFPQERRHARPSLQPRPSDLQQGGRRDCGLQPVPRHQQSEGAEAWFCARADYPLMNAGSRLSAVGEREFLLVGAAHLDQLTSPIAYWKGDDFVPLLKELNPTVVHLHHYVHLGIEIIRTIKNALPDARIFLTLHEYIAICSNFGQMIKTSGRLCYQSSPRECAQCFPGKAPEDFFLRERYIKSFFELVDHFVAPSAFLRDRYIAWGLDPERISVIENGLPDGERMPPRSLGDGDVRGRFAYFGQINPFKGVDLILEACAKLPKKIRSQVSLDIFGSGLESQTEEFRERSTRCSPLTRTSSGCTAPTSRTSCRGSCGPLTGSSWAPCGGRTRRS